MTKSFVGVITYEAFLFLDVAQPGRALHLGCRGRRFEPCRLDSIKSEPDIGLPGRTVNAFFAGSIPVWLTNATVAKLVRHRTFYAKIAGSNPVGSSKTREEVIKKYKKSFAELITYKLEY